MSEAGQGRAERKRKRLVSITAWAILIVTVTTAIEITLRIAMPHLGAEGWSSGAFCQNTEKNYRCMVPNTRTTMVGLDFGHVEIHSNSRGYRDEEWPVDEPSVMVLGDSFGWGWGIADSTTWLNHVRKSVHLPVVNLSIPGDNWFRMQHRYRLHRDELTVDQVVILCYVNDFFGWNNQLQRCDSLAQTGFYSADVQHTVLEGCTITKNKGRLYPFNRLYLHRALRQLYTYFKLREDDETTEAFYTRIGFSEDARFLSETASFDSIAKGYVMEIEECFSGTPVAVVSIPPVYAIDEEKCASVTRATGPTIANYERFRRALIRAFEDAPNARLIDLHHALLRSHIEAPVYFNNDGHLNMHGHAVLGAAVVGAIHPHQP